ncbi:MAG: hypothetical protein MK066_06395, partial [Crocinitomicaceae bacterium]|nr:hypothetical protein [Crocinitomicaceae bacterium]
MKTIFFSLLGILLTPMVYAQTAVCQNVNVYLDGAGSGTITGADIDGGSTDDAATGSLTLTASQTVFSCADIATPASPGLMITGVFDGPLPGGYPKGVELLVTGDILDVSMFGIGSANNGGGSDGEELTFSGGPYTAGTYIYATSDSAGFADFFGFNADFVSGAMSVNGDDAIELFQGGSVIDVFGDINVDGSGQPWEYLDGWAYRNDFETVNRGVFNDANWTYSGINALDGELSNLTASTPFLTGSFSMAVSGAIPVTLIAEDGNLDQDSCVAYVTVLDTVSPAVVCQNVSVYLDASGLALISAADIDGGSTDNCGIVSSSTNIQTFTCSEIGTNPVTLTALDNSGNSSTCISTVTVIDTLSPIASCQDVTVALDASGLAILTPSDVDGGSADNCGLVSMSTNIQTFTCSEIGTNTVDLTVLDNSGNSSTCVSSVIVIDSLSPVALCQDITIALDAAGLAILTPTDVDGGSTDNCGIVSMSTNIQTFTCSEIGTNT